MTTHVHGTDKGILQAEAGKQKFSLNRYQPSPDLALYIEHYWVVRWDLRGQDPFRQVILSYPNVNISFEQEQQGIYAGVYGVPKKTYARLLQDTGIVFGVKFHPGGFYPFWKQPVSMLTGEILSIQEAFGVETTDMTQKMFAMEHGEDMIPLVEQFLRDRLPEPDEQVALIRRIVQAAITNKEILQVEDMAHTFGINKRTLQRLFNRYVGVSPKWVIGRYRLQEAAELMEKGGMPDWSKLSQDLGYYDQAHFIKTFKSMIGKSPEEYVKSLGEV
ncbi:AraC family transcriptional regulator [Paenibacillus sp. HWE-109]|uniref:helix-turn-helix domain-containing protein n=1 Tax=Paenibacillus sp. HWE-109 TaxID=1306526 RepID=UPI001EE10D60|nr:AraC family transcriptional regulator [Paenibacillus sp. HWE-109]UKS25663.1 AraC family transcriptional regulator [Paenibacillus sp. HWE-109]